MERNSLAKAREESVQAPKANLSSLTKWKCQASASASEAATQVKERKVPCNKAGNSRQPRSQDSWSGRDS